MVALINRDKRPTTALDKTALSRTLKPENSPGFLLWQVTNQWQRALRHALEPAGLTHVQYVLLAGLAWLEENEGMVTQARLAQFCRTDPMMTSQVVRTMERDGFLTRERHPTDSRARALRITESGVERVNAAMPTVMRCDKDFFARLGDGQRVFLRDLLQLWQQVDDSR